MLHRWPRPAICPGALAVGGPVSLTKSELPFVFRYPDDPISAGPMPIREVGSAEERLRALRQLDRDIARRRPDAGRLS